MPILCSPVKSRLSARLTVRRTKITFFRCLSRKTASPIRRCSRWPLGSLTQMIKEHSRAGPFARAETLVGSAWDWSDWRVCRRWERTVACPARGIKRNGVVRKWYVRFLMMLEAATLEACRISHANPSSGRRKNGGRVGWAVGTCEESGSRRRRFRSLSGLRTGKGLRGAVCGLNRALRRSA